jgi:prophage regulatory protein
MPSETLTSCWTTSGVDSVALGARPTPKALIARRSADRILTRPPRRHNAPASDVRANCPLSSVSDTAKRFFLYDTLTGRLPGGGKNSNRTAPIGLNRRQDSKMAHRELTPIKRTIRRDQLREMIPLADSTIYEMEQRGDFPRRFALSARCVVWDLAEVEAWLAARRSTPPARAPHPDVRQRRTRPVKGPGQAAVAALKVE